MVISIWNAVRPGYASQEVLSQLCYKLKTELDSVIWPVCEYVGGRGRKRECVLVCVGYVATTLGGTEQALTHALLLIWDEQAVFPSVPIAPLDLSGKIAGFSLIRHL